MNAHFPQQLAAGAGTDAQQHPGAAAPGAPARGAFRDVLAQLLGGDAAGGEPAAKALGAATAGTAAHAARSGAAAATAAAAAGESGAPDAGAVTAESAREPTQAAGRDASATGARKARRKAPEHEARAHGEVVQALAAAGQAPAAGALAALHASSSTQPRAGSSGSSSHEDAAGDRKAGAAASATAREARAADHDKARDRDAGRADAQASATPARPEAPAPAIAPTADGRAARAAAAEAAPSAADALPAAQAGQEVQGAVLRSAAHLTIETPSMGAVELHLRVREGALYLRVDGDAGKAIEAHSGELARALASDGLRLASIDLPSQDSAGLRSGADGGGRGQERREAWNEAADARGRGQPPSSGPAKRTTQPDPRGGVHVQA